ncbi:MAG: permease, partial [Acidimicrobiales bacterium]
VLVVLLGWQFAVGELFGGVVMIVLLASLGGLFLAGRSVARARERAAGGDGASGGHVHGDPSGEQPVPWRQRLRRRGGWVDAATYAVSDLTMLRKELVIGYAVAGFLAVLVPASAWSAFFLHGHGAWTTLENVVVGPLVAVISFVCSVGNVPLAAALWQGGISFGGVVSFVFADLITFPLLLVYRRYYGGRLTLRLLAVFWAIMSVAGLVTEVVFRAAGLVPTTRSATVTSPSVAWNATTWLDIAALAAFAVAYWAYRNRGRLGAGESLTLDPVCGMQVEKPTAPASAEHGGERHYFCSERCLDRFRQDPGRWSGGNRPQPAAHG